MSYITKIAKGYFISAIIFLCLSMMTAVLMKVASVPEEGAFYYLIFAMAAASFFLGIFSGKAIGKNGMVWSALLSAFFVFLIVFATNCAFFKELTPHCFRPFYGIPVIIGAIGGIIGVNVKK